MATLGQKTFKIGEYARGGIITANVQTDYVVLQCRDYDTKEIISTHNCSNLTEAFNVLIDWTSSYWTDEVMDYLKKTNNNLTYRGWGY